ncbi:MAG: DNA helicase HerA-like ATPase [Saprospiraceae bacterium]|jgi:DNA helicase HerA-like ATPase
MSNQESFISMLDEGYTFKGPSIIMGAGKFQEQVATEHFVRIPLKTLNRHGLIAGATGTGKTKTLQILVEQLSANGVPSLVMDIKGDLSGLAVASDGHPKIDERHDLIGYPFLPDSSPVEFLSLSEEKGARLRATVAEFGPLLLAKILNLSDTQEGILSVVFKFCEDRDLPLLDLDDLKKVLNYCTGEGKAEIQEEYGRMSSTSVGTIIRKIVGLEQQGAEIFFGERSFDPKDLMRINENGKGIISILRVTDIQDKPLLFSTFMLQLLAEIYSTFPEEGDSEKPKLCLFIDEAHLVFDEASDVLLNQIETIIKLIRSKGVGIFFITQNPADVPEDVLGQLGLKVQHALRAFTAKDRKAIKLAAQNYPLSDFYNVEQLITELGIGEAFITALDEKGRPTPLVHTYLRAPQSRMDILSDKEINAIIKKSDIIEKYNEEIDRESAYEILSAKIDDARSEAHEEEMTQRGAPRRKRAEKSQFEKVLNSTTTRQIGRTVARELTRGLLGVLGVKTTRRRRKSTSWFGF